MKYPFLAVSIVFLALAPAAALAVGFDCFGCAEMSATPAGLTARALSLDPAVTIDNSHGSQGLTATVRLENVDPDLMVPDDYDPGYGLVRGQNHLTFRVKVLAYQAKTVTIRPFIDEVEDFYFVAMSDNQQPLDSQDINPVFRDIVDQMEVINPLFITNSGDLIKGSGGSASVADRQLERFREEIDRLATTYLTAPGNHDYSPGFAEYEKYLGDTDYGWDWGGTHFTVVNTANQYAGGQLLDTAFLENDLASSGADKKIVLFHHPLRSPDWAALPDQWLSPVNREQVAGILDDNGADLAIVGHAHGYDYRYLTPADIPTLTDGYFQLVTGGAGATINQPGGQYHYNIFHVSPDGIEHWPILKNRFDVEEEWSGSNDGTEDEIVLRLTNLEEQYVPYLRPKFRLDRSFDRVMAKDDAGRYLPVQYRDTGDYNVAYVETDLPANGARTLTVGKADKIHEGRVNTVHADATVEYSVWPRDDSTEVPNLEVSPGSGTTRVKEVSWAADGRSGSWVEVPDKKKRNTTYRFTGLEPHTVYTVAQGGDYWKRVIADGEGRAEFTFKKDLSRRRFSFHPLGETIAGEITSAPASGGGPQVRMFDQDGYAFNEFFAFDEGVKDDFRPYRGELKSANAEPEVIVSRSDKIKVLSCAGNKLAVKKPFGGSYSGGLGLVADDMNRNGRDSLVVAPDKDRRRIKYYKYRNGELKLISKRKVANEGTGLNICTAQADGRGRKEIVVAPASGGERWIKVYRITAKKKLRLLARKDLRNEDFSGGIELACGFFRGKKREDIAAASKTGQVYSWYLKKNGHFKMNFKYADPGPLVLRAGDVNSRGLFKEELVLANQDTGRITVLKYKRSQRKLVRLARKKAFSKRKRINVTLANVDGDYKAEILAAPAADGSQIRVFDYRSGKIRRKVKFWPYGSGFSGGVNLAP